MSQKIFGTITYTNIIIEIGYTNISFNYAEQKTYKIDLRPTCKLIINFFIIKSLFSFLCTVTCLNKIVQLHFIVHLIISHHTPRILCSWKKGFLLVFRYSYHLYFIIRHSFSTPLGVMISVYSIFLFHRVFYITRYYSSQHFICFLTL